MRVALVFLFPLQAYTVFPLWLSIIHHQPEFHRKMYSICCLPAVSWIIYFLIKGIWTLVFQRCVSKSGWQAKVLMHECRLLTQTTGALFRRLSGGDVRWACLRGLGSEASSLQLKILHVSRRSSNTSATPTIPQLLRQQQFVALYMGQMAQTEVANGLLCSSAVCTAVSISGKRV